MMATPNALHVQIAEFLLEEVLANDAVYHASFPLLNVQDQASGAGYHYLCVDAVWAWLVQVGAVGEHGKSAYHIVPPAWWPPMDAPLRYAAPPCVCTSDLCAESRALGREPTNGQGGQFW